MIGHLTLSLLFLLMLMGLSLVHTQQSVRTQFVALERAQAENRQLEMTWTKLQYEQSVLTKTARIVEIASNRAKMKLPTPQDTLYISLAEKNPFVAQFTDKPE